MKKEEKESYWSKKVAEFTRSGKTKEEWCLKKNITIKQFNYWLKQFYEEPVEAQWLQIEMSEQKEENKNSPVSPLNIKIGEVSIEINHGYNKELLLEILTTLKQL